MDYKLKKLTGFGGRPGPLVLVIMDGVGIGKKDKGDAFHLANPVNINRMIEEAKARKLYAELRAHGPWVGLPSKEDMGNSEVGHNAIGGGQVVAQGAKRVNASIESGEILKTPSWKKCIEETARAGKTAHFFGLLSDGNVHSNTTQLFALLDRAAGAGIKKIRVHPLLDGRDVPPDSGLAYLEKLEAKLAELSRAGADARIASGGGRMYVTMDRYYSDWGVVKRGYYAHVYGKILDEEITSQYKGYFTSAREAVETARRVYPDKQDQFNPPFVIVDGAGNPVGRMEDGDAVINFNFRGDRAIEISEAFLKKDFKGFDRGKAPPRVKYAGLLEYDAEARLPPDFLVPPPSIQNVSAQYLCASGVKSYAVAETHKFGHVTYFWNGNRSGYIDEKMEKYEEIRSLPSETIEAQPEMKIFEVTDRLVAAIKSGQYRYLRVNFANGDMVGHTGNIESCIKAMRALDACMKRVVDETAALGGLLVISADHGNVEEKLDKKGKVVTSHSLNPVPFLVVDPGLRGEYTVDASVVAEPGVGNITASFINLLGFVAPDFYEKSLIRFS